MSNLWVIKDAGGNVTNPCIKGSEDFVKATFSHYEAFVESGAPTLTADQEARKWRDSELVRTDSLSLLADFPKKTELAAYRTKLRDWPSSSEFPDTKPEM